MESIQRVVAEIVAIIHFAVAIYCSRYRLQTVIVSRRSHGLLHGMIIVMHSLFIQSQGLEVPFLVGLRRRLLRGPLSGQAQMGS